MDIIRISSTLSTTIVVLASLWIVGAVPATSPCPQTCTLPDCQCASKDIPGGLRRDQVPQMVTITFDDAIREKDYDMIYSKILRGRSNPNGCNVSATFFASHANTDYSLATELANNGYFELAVHSVTDRTPATFWSGDRNNTEELTREILDMRDILSRWAHVPKSNVVGYRSPHLASSENQLKILHENDFLYDSTMVTNEMYWPFTLDYKSPICSSPAVCPEDSLPGLWVVPNIKKVQNSNASCNLIDSCNDMEKSTKEEWMDFFMDNFERHYNNSKAPFGLYATSSWFLSDKSNQRLQAFLDFLDHLGNLEDVYIVTMSQLIAWSRDPTPLDQLMNSTFDPWQCPNLLPTNCTHNDPNICKYRIDGQEFIIRLCKDDICPDKYPNINNPRGENTTLSSTSVTLTSEIISTSVTSTSHISSSNVMSSPGSEINPSSSTILTSATAPTASVTSPTTSVNAETFSVTAPSSFETTQSTIEIAPTTLMTTPTPFVTGPLTAVNTQTTSVTAPTTSVTAPTTSVTAPTTSVTAQTTSVTAPTTSVTTSTTSVTAPTTSVTAPTTSVTAQTTSVTAPTTSVTTSTTFVTAPTTSVTAPTTSVTAPTTSVTAQTTSVTAPTTSVTTSTTSVTTSTTSVTAPTTSVTAPTTSVTAPTTSVTAPSTSVTAQTTSVATPTTSVTTSTTSVTAPATSVTAPTTSVTVPTTSVTVPTKSVTAQTTSVATPTTSVTTSTTSVTAPATSVTAPTTSVTAPTTSVTAPTTSVTVPTTSVTAPITSVTVPTKSVTVMSTFKTTTPTITSATPTTVTISDPGSTTTNVPITEDSRQQTRSVDPGVVAGLTIAGVMAILVAVTGIVILVYIKWKQMHSRAPTSVSPELGLSLVNPGADST